MPFYSVIAELERIRVQWDKSSDAELKTLCPFHNDSTPSLYINSETGAADCKSCSWSGSFVGYLAKKEGKLLAQIYYELEERYGILEGVTIAPKRIYKSKEAIWKNKILLKELKNRGLTNDDIKEAHLGVERNKITIPIYDEKGYCVNFRKYLPGAPSDKKFRDEKGCGKTVRLYPVSQLRYSRIVLCGGEIKALSAAKHLNPSDIGAISGTGGEGRWSLECSEALNGKEKIWIAYDVDAAGKANAKKLAHQLAAYVGWLGIVQLPLDVGKYPHGGIDDFLVKGGKILPLLEECEQYEPKKENVRDYESEQIQEYSSLAQVVTSDNIGSRISVDCVISSMDTMPYAVPKLIKCKCPKSVDWCTLCDMFALKPEDMIKEIHPEDPAILEMIDVAAENIVKPMKRACGIPENCKVCTFETLEFQHAEDTRISENLDVAKRAEDKSMIPAVVMADSMTMNEPYTVVGRLYPNPKTNQSVLLVANAKKKRDSLSTFDVTNTLHLEKFRPKEWTKEGLGDKLNEIYEDLESNVTRIYKRRMMHLMIDLAYHSPLFIKFRGKRVKGWVEILVLGDSSQGKTETAMNLQQHYGLGSWLSCKGASIAGIIGGLQQINKRWFVTWGAMPTQDRRLLVLEELKGLEPEALAKLTDARSSGVAELVKIEKRRTYSRVRLVALSNPRSDRALSTYNSGVDAIKELVGSLEDIRRFDGFYIANKSDIDYEDVIGRTTDVPHRYVAEDCRDMVLWAWAIKSTRFEDEDHLLHKSLEFGRMYSDDIPIYDRGGGRYKLARLAAALACRTYSCEDPREVFVRKCHVEYICEFLHKIYSSESFGYREFSARQKELESIVDEDQILKELNASSFPLHYTKTLLNGNSLNTTDLGELFGWSFDESRTFLSMLIRTHCVRRSGRTYYKTGPFVKFLKASLENNEIIDRPDYINTEELT